MRTCLSCKKLAPDEAGFCPGCGTQFPIVQAKKGVSGKVVALIAVIVLVPILVACTGIIAAIAIPNFLGATERARQKRALGEMRSLSGAIQVYENDKGMPPLPLTGGSGGWEEVPVSQIETNLTPDYIQTLPAADPWGKPYLYGFSPEEKRYYLLSTGRAGQREVDGFPDASRVTHCYESDILLVDGDFLQYPEGKQSVCGEEVLSRETAPGQ